MPGKRSLNASAIPSAKRERKAITLDIKLEVLRRFEVGEKLSQIAKALGLAVSTVATIRDNKEKIKANSQIATPLRASRLTRHRSAVMETMERLLHVWLEDQSQRNVPLSVTIIQEKAKSLFDDLQRERGASSQTEKFTASKGWFVRFKERHCLPHFKINSTAPGNKDIYPKALRSIIEEGWPKPSSLGPKALCHRGGETPFAHSPAYGALKPSQQHTQQRARLHHIPADAWETDDGPHGAAYTPPAQHKGDVQGLHPWGLQNTKNTLTLAMTSRLDARQAWVGGCLLL
uniref:HTH CENPB-type domain-containing protein n=1 Tax=Felis catus TaxID=9685 RepID=A0ABI7VTU8_FELCA